MDKKIFKVLGIILALGLLISGCGNGGNEQNQTTEVSELDSEGQVPESDQVGESEELGQNPDGPVLQGEALEDGVLDLGTNAAFPPYEFIEGGEIVGIDIDIANEICNYLGYELRMHDMEFSSIISAIESGKLDGGISGFTVTEERKQSVNFSDSYANSVQVVLVLDDSEIQDIDMLDGNIIGTQLGTTGDIYAKEDFGEEDVQSFDKFADAIMAMQSDRVQAVMVDQQTAVAYANTNDQLRILETAYAEEEYAIALDINNELLLEEVNTALRALKDSGRLQEIIDKYINE